MELCARFAKHGAVTRSITGVSVLQPFSCFSRLFFFFSSFAPARKSRATALVPIGYIHASLFRVTKLINSYLFCLNSQEETDINEQHPGDKDFKYLPLPDLRRQIITVRTASRIILLSFSCRTPLDPVGQTSGLDAGWSIFATITEYAHDPSEMMVGKVCSALIQRLVIGSCVLQLSEDSCLEAGQRTSSQCWCRARGGAVRSHG